MAISNAKKEIFSEKVVDDLTQEEALKLAGAIVTSDFFDSYILNPNTHVYTPPLHILPSTYAPLKDIAKGWKEATDFLATASSLEVLTADLTLKVPDEQLALLLHLSASKRIPEILWIFYFSRTAKDRYSFMAKQEAPSDLSEHYERLLSSLSYSVVVELRTLFSRLR